MCHWTEGLRDLRPRSPGKVLGIPWADRHSPLKKLGTSREERVRVESFLLAPDCKLKSHEMSVLFFVCVPKIVFGKKNSPEYIVSSILSPDCL